MNAPEKAQELAAIQEQMADAFFTRYPFGRNRIPEQYADGFRDAWNRRAPVETDYVSPGPQSAMRVEATIGEIRQGKPAPYAPAPQNKAPQVSEEELERLAYASEVVTSHANSWKRGYRAASDRWAQRVAELEERVFQAECKESMSYDLIAKLEERIEKLRKTLSDLWNYDCAVPGELADRIRAALAADDRDNGGDK